jgi:hypothetical protein
VPSGTDRRAHRVLGPGEQLVRQLLQGLQPGGVHQREQTLLHQLVGARLRPDVADGLIGRAHVGADHLDQGLVGAPLAHELHQRDVDALLEHLARLDGAEPPADVGHVRGGGREGDEPAGAEDRLEHAHVAHVARAHPRVVGDEDVAGPHRRGAHGAQEVAHGGGQGADERRNAAAVLRQRVTAGVGQHACEVVRLVRERRERRAHDRLGGLVDDRDQPRPQHLERDRVESRAHDDASFTRE